MKGIRVTMFWVFKPVQDTNNIRIYPVIVLRVNTKGQR